MKKPSLAILGIRGIPNMHGGFESFAERLGPYLVERGWRVTVYCQTEGITERHVDTWEGVDRIHLPSRDGSGGSSIIFDWRSISDVLRGDFDLTLTLGYNTAIFCARLRLNGVVNLMNMDGIEWARSKWSPPARAWFYLNDRIGCLVSNHLIADHPEIRTMLSTRVRDDKISVIAYGADRVDQTSVSSEVLSKFGVEPDRYLTLIARPEPENSVLEIVEAFSAKKRGIKLLVLGRYVPEKVPLHRRILAAASREVVFAGPIYDPNIVRALRVHCLFYVHGHRVGGTNPSLVEALGAGNAVVAHDNKFNRAVAQDAGVYFSSAADCASRFDEVLAEPERLRLLRTAARRRHDADFHWGEILSKYETLLRAHLPVQLRDQYPKGVTDEERAVQAATP